MLKNYLMSALALTGALFATSAARAQSPADSVTVTLNWKSVNTANEVDVVKRFIIGNQTGYTLLDTKALGTTGTSTVKVPKGVWTMFMQYDYTNKTLGGNMIKIVAREDVDLRHDTTMLFDGAEATRHIGFRYLLPDGREARLKTWETSKNLVWTGANVFRFIMYSGIWCSKIPDFFSPGLYSLNENRPYMPKGSGANVCRSGDVFVNPGLSSAWRAYNDALVYQLDTVRKAEMADVPMLYISQTASCAQAADTIFSNDPASFRLHSAPERKASLFTPKPAAPKGLYRLEHLNPYNGKQYGMITVGAQADPLSRVNMCIGKGTWDILLTLSSQETTKIRTYAADSGSGIAMPAYMAQRDEYVVNDPIFTGNAAHAWPEDGSGFKPYPGHPVFSYKAEELGDTIGDSAPFHTISLLTARTTSERHPKWFTNQCNMEWVGNAIERRAVDMWAQKFYCIAGGDTIVSDWKKFAADGNKYVTKADAKSDITLSFDNANYRVDTLQGHSTALYTLNLLQADICPPALRAVQMRSRLDNRITNRHVRMSEIRLGFACGDFNFDQDAGFFRHERADVKLEIAPFGTENYTEVPVHELTEHFRMPVWGNYYEADLSGYKVKSANGWFALRFTLTDRAGNKCVQTASPALYAEHSTLSVGSVTESAEGLQMVGDRLVSADASECIMVYDASGRLVLSSVGSADLSPLPRGLYVARAGSSTLKFMRARS